MLRFVPEASFDLETFFVSYYLHYRHVLGCARIQESTIHSDYWKIHVEASFCVISILSSQSQIIYLHKKAPHRHRRAEDDVLVTFLTKSE